MHHACHGRCGPGADVGDRAGDGAGGWHAAKERHHGIGNALRHQLLVGVVLGRVAELVGHARAEQRLDGAQNRNGEGGGDQQAHGVPGKGRQLEDRPALRNAAEAGANRLYRQAECPGQQRQRNQRHHRCGYPRGGTERAHGFDLVELPAELGIDRPQSRPDEKPDHTDDAKPQRIKIEAANVTGNGADLAEEIGRHLGDLQAEQVAHLRERDQYRNAVGEANDHTHWHVTHQGAQPEQTEQEKQHTGAGGGDQQVGHAVALDDAVDDHDEGAGRSADLHRGTSQRRDDEASDDGGPQTGFGLEPAGNGKRHGQRQRHDAHRDARTHVAHQFVPGVALEVLNQARAEWGKRRQSLEHRQMLPFTTVREADKGATQN